MKPRCERSGPSRSSQPPNPCSDAAACEQRQATRRFEQLARVCVGQIMVHLRRSEPAKRSAYLFCQGEESDVGRSRIPIAHVSLTHVLCFSLRFRWEPLAAVADPRRMLALAQRLRLPLLQLLRRQARWPHSLGHPDVPDRGARLRSLVCAVRGAFSRLQPRRSLVIEGPGALLQPRRILSSRNAITPTQHRVQLYQCHNGRDLICGTLYSRLSWSPP
jgi:hypothetical protein